MEIKLQALSKQFERRWLFRDLNHTLGAPGAWSITGPNGAGKTTLLHIIAGLTSPSTGKLIYQSTGKVISSEDWYKHTWLAAPYVELLEELTLKEFWQFHRQLKPMLDLSPQEFAERCQLGHALNRTIQQYSSGMKQRVKLGLGFYSQVPILLLDEPTTNLDQKGQQWYQQEMRNLLSHKLLIICSNQPEEYTFCTNNISLGQP